MRQFDTAYEKKQYTKASAIAAEACEAFPDNWYFLYLCAESLYNDGHERWGTPHLDVLEKVERLCDVIIGAIEGKASLTVEAPEKDNSAYILRAFVLLGKGERFLLLKKLEEARDSLLDAEQQFMDVLESSPDDLTALIGYAKTLMELGTEDRPTCESFLLARDCFRGAIALDETYGQAYVTCSVGYSILLMRNNENAEALEVLNTALKRCPENELLECGRDTALKRIQRLTESEHVDSKLLTRPDDTKQNYRGADCERPVKTQPHSRAPLRIDFPLRS
jgi:tetratricopeptide (TPR) repeat protein